MKKPPANFEQASCAVILTAVLCIAAATTSTPATAQNASKDSAMMPIASVAAVSLLGVSAVSDSVNGGNITELMMSNANNGKASFIIVAVGSVATGTVYVVQQASGALKLSITVPGQSIAKVGDSLNALSRPTGVVVTTEKNEVLAFVPNARGAALTANEKAN